MLDGDGERVPDAIIEIWQANSHGKYAHPEDPQEKPMEPGFKVMAAFRRMRMEISLYDDQAGGVPGPDGKLQAPHLAVSVFMRGLLRRLVTRIYFPDEPGNAGDFALDLWMPGGEGRLIAKRIAGAGGLLKWNVIIQGPGETVFFDS